MLPEIIFFAKLKDALSRDSYFLIPDIKGFVVFQIHAGVQALRIKAGYFCEKLPCPSNRLMFKVISKREISQHFKKGAMSCCFAYILNIAGTYALLAGSNPLAGRNLLSGKIRL